MTALIFVLCFSAGCILALVRNPIYGLLAYVGVFYVNPPERWWGKGALLDFRWSVIAAGVTLAAILIHRTGRDRRKFWNQPIVWIYFALIAWLAIQLLWVMEPDQQQQLLEYYLKFGVALYLMSRTLTSEANIRLFLWAHVIGCFYFGWLAYTTNQGGRFEEFGGAGVKDANEAALAIGTGAMVLGALLLREKLYWKAVLIAMAPFLVNAIVATVSRSGFLALALGGLVFNLLAPAKYRKWVVPLSAMAVVLMLILTTEDYWSRIETITYRGQEVEGKDTGSHRLELMAAQLQMSRAYPLGCGHTCTAILSPQYVRSELLATEAGVRSSHNTFLSMLVEHGIPGAILYLSVVVLVIRRVVAIHRNSRRGDGFVPVMLPAIGGALAAIGVADMFVPYMRFEIRFWFIGLLWILWRLQSTQLEEAESVRTDGQECGDAKPQRRATQWR